MYAEKRDEKSDVTTFVSSSPNGKELSVVHTTLREKGRNFIWKEEKHLHAIENYGKVIEVEIRGNFNIIIDRLEGARLSFSREVHQYWEKATTKLKNQLEQLVRPAQKMVMTNK